jgi:ubiquinone biosynthesis protein UbiJ
VIDLLKSLLTREALLARCANAIMRVLHTDSLASARLREFTGRVIALQINGVDTTVYAAVDDGSLLLATSAAREPDVILSGRIADFAAFAQARRATQAIPAGKLQIQGDLATAQSLQRLLDELDIDWEALLAAQVGDLAAHQIGRGVRHGLAWLREARAAWVEDVPAYLQHERHWVPTTDDVERFAREGMALVSDVDRLAARVARLRDRQAGCQAGRQSGDEAPRETP